MERRTFTCSEVIRQGYRVFPQGMVVLEADGPCRCGEILCCIPRSRAQTDAALSTNERRLPVSTPVPGDDR